VHALFADDALAALHAAGAGTVATCNTIVHPTNAIDLCEDIARSVAPLVRR
jgi:ribose-phosphate pyrophosphokinase